MTAVEIQFKDYLPDCDLPLWQAVELAAWRYACLTNLPLKEIEPSRNQKPGSCLGLCYIEEGRVSIRIRSRKKNGSWEAADSGAEIVDTLAHELAHLVLQRGDEVHGRRWKLEYDELREAMLEDGLDDEFERLREK